ncbi:MAG: sigma-70 family RNA polymerase sigma factor [Chloroflexi bacterium]|nr:sigma-70 family RNA polymerase sigma factor [Anaerolineaceae bacterium]NMB87417.1 sigma-70 family RNA polymerase sigma factor [Chloroflexota bacterium]
MAQPAPRPPIDLSEQFERTYPAIYRYFRYRGADVDAANDLAAAVFERALTRLASFDPDKGSFHTWLFTIAHHTAINDWKARARAWLLPLEAAAARPAPDPSPEAALEQRQRQADLLAALGTLERRPREILALKFAGRLTNRQIAGLTGLSEANVGVILYRALRRLKAALSAGEEQVRHE